MRFMRLFHWACLSLLFIPNSIGAERNKIAFFDFDYTGDRHKASCLGKAIPDLLELHFSTLQNFSVLERRELANVLAEHELSLSVDANKLKSGELIDANLLCFGTITLIGDTIEINARIVASPSTDILCMSNAKGRASDLWKLMESLSQDLISKLPHERIPHDGAMSAKTVHQRINLPEKFIDALKAQDADDMQKAICALRQCFSCDPKYFLERRSYFKKITEPIKMHIPISYINKNSLYYENRCTNFIRSHLKEIDLSCSNMEKIVIWNDLGGKPQFEVSEKQLRGNAPNCISQYYYDTIAGKLFHIFIEKSSDPNSKISSLGKGIVVRDVPADTITSSWESAHFYKEPDFCVYRPSAGANLQIVIPARVENSKAITFKAFDLLTGQEVGEFARSLNISPLNIGITNILLQEGKTPHLFYKESPPSNDYKDIIHLVRLSLSHDSTSWEFNTMSNRADCRFITSSRSSPSLFSINNKNNDHVESLILDSDSFAYVDSRNDCSLGSEIINLFSDARSYFVNRGQFLQRGLLCPPFSIGDPLDTFVADFDNDNQCEILSNKTFYKIKEHLDLLPAENNLVTLSAFSTCRSYDIQSNNKRGKHGIAQALSRWEDVKLLNQLFAIALSHAALDTDYGIYLFDPQRLKGMLTSQQIIPETDIDDYSLRQAYHMTRARWQTTIRLDISNDSQYTIDVEVVDKGKPIFKPAFHVTQKGDELPVMLRSAASEVKDFLVSKNKIQTAGSTTTGVNNNLDKIPVSLLVNNISRSESSEKTLIGIADMFRKTLLAQSCYQLLERTGLKDILQENDVKTLIGKTDNLNKATSLIISLTHNMVDHHSYIFVRSTDAETSVILAADAMEVPCKPNSAFIEKLVEDHLEKLNKRIPAYTAYKFQLMRELYTDYLAYKATSKSKIDKSSPRDESAPVTPTASPPIRHLKGTVTADTILNMNQGTPCVSGPLTIRSGVQFTLASDTTLVVSAAVTTEHGSKFIMKPGSKIVVNPEAGAASGNMRFCIKGAFSGEGTKEKPISISLADSALNEQKKSHVAQSYSICFEGEAKEPLLGLQRDPSRYHPTQISFLNVSNVNLTFSPQSGIKINDCDFMANSNVTLNDPVCRLTSPPLSYLDITNVKFHSLRVHRPLGIMRNCFMSYIRFELEYDFDGEEKLRPFYPPFMDKPLLTIYDSDLKGLILSSNYWFKTPAISFVNCNFRSSTDLSDCDYRKAERRKREGGASYKFFKDQIAPLFSEFDDNLSLETQKHVIIENCFFPGLKTPDEVRPIFKNMSLEIKSLSAERHMR